MTQENACFWRLQVNAILLDLTRALMGRGGPLHRGQMRKDVNLEVNWGSLVSNKLDS